MKTRRRRNMKTAKKAIVLVMCAALLVVGTVAGTMAYLTDKTETVTNTFTVGNIDITLKETTGSAYKMVPGVPIDKDPTVTVVDGSEKCWLFVKIDKSENFDNFMKYTVASEWTELSSGSNVYYREVTTPGAFTILGAGSVTEGSVTFNWIENQVFVSSTVTKANMDNLTDQTLPKLSFTAYAVQYEGLIDKNHSSTTVDEAWALANPAT